MSAADPQNAVSTREPLPAPIALPLPSVQSLARRTLTAFLVTFLFSRVVVLLIMTRHFPDMFLYVGQTHVHHLNYGIFLLVIVGAWGVFARPRGRTAVRWMPLAYGVGLGLTFDEFGMWLHLGGGYWQRASYDAVVWVGVALSLLSTLPGIRRWKPLHWTAALAIVCVSVYALKLMSEVLNLWQPFLKQLESLAPQ